MILLCGYTYGKPNSIERGLQSQRLWSKSIAYLRTKRTGEEKVTFLRCAMSLREGDSYYFSAVHLAESILDIPNLLCCFVQTYDPATRWDPATLENPEAMR